MPVNRSPLPQAIHGLMVTIQPKYRPLHAVDHVHGYFRFLALPGRSDVETTSDGNDGPIDSGGLETLLPACIALWVAIGATAQNAVGSPDLLQRDFVCNNGARLVVVFQTAEAVVQLSNGRRLTLRQQRMASGFAYADADYTLRGRGDRITLSGPNGMSMTDCSVDKVPLTSGSPAAPPAHGRSSASP
jgi:membrane-bound inhibitor of C-type lysozyme